MKSSISTQRLPQRAAEWLSLLFHPLTMMAWMVLFVMVGLASPLTYTLPIISYVVGTVIFMTLVVPCLFLWLLHLLGVTRRGENGERRTSIMMLVVVAVCYTCCGWVFDDVVVLFLIRKMLYSATGVVAMLLLFELFYPLCYHTTAVGAVLGMMWMLLVVGNYGLLYPFIAGIVVAGLLISSRLYLSKCSLGSAVWGLLLGFGLACLLLIVI